jgi:hypothetical protein
VILMALKADLQAATTAAQTTAAAKAAADLAAAQTARQALVFSETLRARAEMTAASTAGRFKCTVSLRGVVAADPVQASIENLLIGEAIPYTVEVTPKPDQVNIHIDWS